MSAELKQVAEKITGETVSSIEQETGGGNSRIYKVICGRKTYALKAYPTIENDKRDRMGVERKALEFFATHSIESTPRFIASEPPYALIEWIEGGKVEKPNMNDIDTAVAFLASVHALSKATSPDAMPLASEACLSPAEILRQVLSRLERLKALDEPELADFIAAEFLPALQKRMNATEAAYREADFSLDEPLEQEERALIPADFGFHNALRTKYDGLKFIDFEYFGWDDPVKLLSDFLLHPAMKLTAPMRQRFHDGMMEKCALSDAAKRRFTALYPLFGLRWTLILLNEFLPERYQARAAARGDSNWKKTKRDQLRKARKMLEESESFA